MPVSSANILDNEIDIELKPYIEKLADPCFYERLIDFAKNASKSEALVILDLVDITSTLSIAGKSWVEELSWDTIKKQANIPQLISAIENNNLNISSAKKILIWINVGSEVPLPEISQLQDQIKMVGNQYTDYRCGINLDSNNSGLFECMILVGGLE